jgi:predicted transcriptional regulator
MKYRSRSDIISEILDTANDGGATKTKIMYKICLSHNQLKEYLMVLMDKDLLSYDLQINSFKTAEKGLGLLNATIR